MAKPAPWFDDLSVDIRPAIAAASREVTRPLPDGADDVDRGEADGLKRALRELGDVEGAIQEKWLPEFKKIGLTPEQMAILFELVRTAPAVHSGLTQAARLRRLLSPILTDPKSLAAGREARRRERAKSELARVEAEAREKMSLADRLRRMIGADK